MMGCSNSPKKNDIPEPVLPTVQKQCKFDYISLPNIPVIPSQTNEGLVKLIHLLYKELKLTKKEIKAYNNSLQKYLENKTEDTK